MIPVMGSTTAGVLTIDTFLVLVFSGKIPTPHPRFMRSGPVLHIPFAGQTGTLLGTMMIVKGNQRKVPFLRRLYQIFQDSLRMAAFA
jgi:hypothetical protein